MLAVGKLLILLSYILGWMFTVFLLKVTVLAPGSLDLTSAEEMLTVLVTEKMLILTSSGWAMMRTIPMITRTATVMRIILV